MSRARTPSKPRSSHARKHHCRKNVALCVNETGKPILLKTVIQQKALASYMISD